MDKTAIWFAEDGVLQKLGIKADGDQIKLKLFCKSHTLSSEDRKIELKSYLQSGDSRVGKELKRKRKAVTHKTLYLNWHHYDSKQRKYIRVSSKKGGGSKQYKFDLNMDYEAVLSVLVKLFWSEDTSYKKRIFGRKADMEFSLSDMCGESLKQEIENLDDVIVPFSVQSYLERHRSTRPHLVLRSKCKPLMDIFNENISSDSDDGIFDQSFNLQSSSSTQSTSTLTRWNANVNVVSEQSSLFSSDTPHTTELDYDDISRRNLIAEQDIEFYKSLKPNQVKENEKKKEEIESQRLRDRMKSCQSKVRPEPDLSEPHVCITVRSFSGNKTRIFRESSLFSEVYNWVGGLAMQPEHFVLVLYNGERINPNDKVYSGIFNVETTTALMETDEKNQSEASEVHLPLSVDNNSDEEETDHNTSFEMLELLRSTELDKINDKLELELSRDNVYNEMMQLYKKRGILARKISFKFVNEGVPQAFRIPEEDLELIGKIIHHAYIQYGVFPLQFCKASLKYSLFKTVEEAEVCNSFYRYIPDAETTQILRYSQGKDVDAQAIIDILCEYSVYHKPTSENVLKLCSKVANYALIRSPYFAVQSIVKGMGFFWTKLDKHMIDALYSCTAPTPKGLISSLSATETCPKDQRVTTWLHRYIRSCANNELLTLLRFVTGTTSLMPNSVIKVEYVNQVPGHLHPVSQTCFQILILPRQYSSFYDLKENLSFYLNRPEAWAVDDHFDTVTQPAE